MSVHADTPPAQVHLDLESRRPDSGPFAPGSPEASGLHARIPALDGLRAIAILVVLLHNAGSVAGELDGMWLKLWVLISNAGWMGVQLFFVLSGFLITRILLESRGGAGWVRSFYVRRVLRIMPLYYLTLAFIFYVAPHVDALAPIAVRGPRSSLWYWTYMSNWVEPFGGLAIALPHVWSLAVEEQFYLVWPLLVSRTSERALARVALAMIAGAFVVRLALRHWIPQGSHDSAAYSYTFARCDAIAFGALVALAVRNARAMTTIRRYLRPALVATVALLLGIVLVEHGLSAKGPVAELFSQPLSAFLSALMVITCVEASRRGATDRFDAAVSRRLSARWLTTIGKYSYAIYVFHRPVHLLMRSFVGQGFNTGSGNRRLLVYAVYTVAVFAVSLLLAMISWRLLEQPILSFKRYFPTPVGPGGERVPVASGR